MKKNALNTEKGNSPVAFLPEMVLEHLRHSKPTELKNKDSVKQEKTTIPLQTIVFDPLADPFDGSIIEVQPIKKKTKSFKKADKTNIQVPTIIIAENKVFQLVKKMKIYFFNF